MLLIDLLFLLYLSFLSVSLTDGNDNNNISDNRDDNNKERLSKFYKRIKEPDVKYCEDKTKLLPDCTECIPGLRAMAEGLSHCCCCCYIVMFVVIVIIVSSYDCYYSE